MEASTHVEVGVDRLGRSVVRRMHCEVPLLVRVAAGAGPVVGLLLVNGAAGPLGGDRLRLRLDVEPDARVEVRSVAAAMAQPGPHGEPSRLEVVLSVGERAALHWAPEPTVSVAGSDHLTSMHITASASSAVQVCEAVSLGRHGEPPGRLALRQRVVIDGAAVLDHETVFAPGALLGPGAHGPARTVSSTVVIGTALPAPGATVNPGEVGATVHLSPVCALVTRSLV